MEVLQVQEGQPSSHAEANKKEDASEPPLLYAGKQSNDSTKERTNMTGMGALSGAACAALAGDRWV